MVETGKTCSEPSSNIIVDILDYHGLVCIETYNEIDIRIWIIFEHSMLHDKVVKFLSVSILLTLVKSWWKIACIDIIYDLVYTSICTEFWNMV